MEQGHKKGNFSDIPGASSKSQSSYHQMLETHDSQHQQPALPIPKFSYSMGPQHTDKMKMFEAAADHEDEDEDEVIDLI